APHHPRRLPADDVITETSLALPRLLARCGIQPERWKSLRKALGYGPETQSALIRAATPSWIDLTQTGYVGTQMAR
ncbi:hypothetical protein, partial [Streptomyces spongiae]|uniref:hypothetical protein n=1 Tax=Streptomyces spongiae TaxID=565072 RepID=UPI0018832F58